MNSLHFTQIPTARGELPEPVLLPALPLDPLPALLQLQLLLHLGSPDTFSVALKPYPS